MGGVGLEGQISEFVDDQELWFGKMREPLLEPAFAVTLGELGNDRSGGDELHGIPGHDRFASESYRKMGLATEYKHETVNHSAGEYARPGGVHSNTVEGYFGLLKRGLYGTYHHVSEAHLQRYINEFDFRFTHRTAQGVNDMQRAVQALSQIRGKRLTYRRTVRQQEANAD